MSRFPFIRVLRTGLVGFGALALTLAPSGVAVADDTEDVENFSFSSWDLSYELSLDSQGRAHAEVTEELVARFPDFDQNRGIVRALPLRYQGAPATPEDITVTDGEGAQVPFETENDGGFRSILVGDDSFVYGEQTYVISYTVADVMHATDEADEFYWDLVPVDRNQIIDAVSAEITLDAQLSSAMTGESACYLGTPEDSQACSMSSTEAAEAVFTVYEENLSAGQGLTVGIGVEQGTVTQPPEREDSFALDILPLILAGAGGLVATGGALTVVSMRRRHREVSSSTVVQYGIPEGMSPLIASPLISGSQNALVPAILDLAVRGAVRIVESADQGRWTSKKPKPVLELLRPELATDPLETQLLAGLFPGLEQGATFDFPKNDKVFTKTSQEVLRASRKEAVDRGYLEPVRHPGAAWAGCIGLALQIPAVILVFMGLSRDNPATTAITVVVALLTLMLTLVSVVKQKVHTPEGAALRAQLERVRQMMKASEAERIEMMQSYAGAGRTPASPGTRGDSDVVRVYDQLLPYAVLFGLQKDWSKVLSNVYHQHHAAAPLWYPALFAHGSQGIESSLNSVLGSVSTAAGTSSSGAGASGGGAAGGGGGGGAAGGR